MALPSIDIKRDVTTPYTAHEFEIAKENIAGIHRGEMLRKDLIDLSLLRADNKIGLVRLEGKQIDLDIASEGNAQKRARLTSERTKTGIEFLRGNLLALESSQVALQIQGKTLELQADRQRLEQQREKLQIELQAGALGIEASKQALLDQQSQSKLKLRAALNIPHVRLSA